MPGTPPGRIAYLGPPGTFTEAALISLNIPGDHQPVPTVDGVLDALRTGEVEAAIVPLENSIEGSVSTTLDELAVGEPLVIVREVILPVSFALLVRPGTTMAEVTTVSTIPHAEAQVRGWLREHLPNARFIPASSTAAGAEAVAQGRADAAVAAPIAASRYGLERLAEDIHDNEDAVTRFVLVRRVGGPPSPPTGADRSTLVAFISEDHPGALLEILTEFAVRGVNLTRLESRPTGSGLGRYCFSIDLEGHVAEARVGEALSALRRICLDVRFLGSYARADGGKPTMKRGVEDADFADAAAWLRRLRQGT